MSNKCFTIDFFELMFLAESVIPERPIARSMCFDDFSEKTDLGNVHGEYTKSPHLYSYASYLDRYIDYLEEQLEKP